MKKENSLPESMSKMRKSPALTPEARENQLIALAVDLVEERLRNKTASAQEIVHYLKLATTKETLEKEYLRKQIELAEAKSHAIRSDEEANKRFDEAIKAFASYRSSNCDDK